MVGAPIVAKGTGGGGEAYALDFPAANRLRFFKNINGYKDCLWGFSDSTLPPNTWNYLAVVYSHDNNGSAIVNFYVNNQNVLTCSTFTDMLPTNDHKLSIGSREGGVGNYDMNFAGKIDDLRLYNRALTSGEITALYNLRPTPTPAPP